MATVALDQEPVIGWNGPEDLPVMDRLQQAFGGVGVHQPEQTNPATDRLFARLDADDIRRTLEIVRDQQGLAAYRHMTEYLSVYDQKHFRREILRFGTYYFPEVVGQKTGLHCANPPAHIHSMMRRPIFVGDQYSGDLFVEELERCGEQIEAGGNYMDFGCSSGAAVRYLAAAYPESQWCGCDPVVESMAWASEHVRGVDFHVSPQWPPLSFETGTFAGVYAISIWSHFSERAALAWFDEMARIIKPGGVLMFTTHGVVTLARESRLGASSTEHILEAALDLIHGRFRYEDIYANNAEIRTQLDSVSDWGTTFIPTSWVMVNLLDRWDLMSFRPGRNQANQDLYLLRRKPVG